MRFKVAYPVVADSITQQDRIVVVWIDPINFLLETLRHFLDMFNNRATETAGAKTWFTITRPVLQRLIDGRTLGIAVTPLGSINASFSTRETDVPRLLLNIKE